MMTPAAQLAFQRAEQLAPDHPAPRFFYGLALAQGGSSTRPSGSGASCSPKPRPTPDYRQIIEQQLQAIRQAQGPGQGPPQPPPSETRPPAPQPPAQ